MLPKQEVQRVLAIQIGSQQDVIQTIPALEKLRYSAPNAVITLMVSPSVKQLSNIRWVDNVLVYEDAENRFKNSECELALIEKLRLSAFDAAVIFTNSGESPYALAYSCYLAGIPIRVGDSQEFGGGVLSHALDAERFSVG
jgi:ADP-heptose:LPS heptosyltransferase